MEDDFEWKNVSGDKSVLEETEKPTSNKDEAAEMVNYDNYVDFINGKSYGDMEITSESEDDQDSDEDYDPNLKDTKDSIKKTKEFKEEGEDDKTNLTNEFLNTSAKSSNDGAEDKYGEVKLKAEDECGEGKECKCKLCFKLFKTDMSLKQHIRRQHEQKEEGKTWECKWHSTQY